MKTYLIGYDLNRPRGNDDYKDLIDAIKDLDNWWNCLDSTWIVRSEMTAVQIRNTLQRYIDSGDELLVVHLSGEGAWIGFKGRCSTWLTDNL